MKRTTVYLPEELKHALERLAKQEERSEAEIIREAISAAVLRLQRPDPRLPLTDRGLADPTAAARVRELLEGFGRS